MGKRTRADVNLLDLVPRRTAEHEIDEEHLVTVLMPRFRNRFMQRWLVPRYRSPHIKIKLDEIGSEVWLLCDGRRNVGEIAVLMREKFNERIEPCNDRLARFFKQLEQARFISYTNLEERLKAVRA
ncbi:MAG: PqqD family protein [Candidatus Krumholzibacteria bacterium]|nr:PqqD family protein [Candidatus Krumholzibacteria bacterium]